MFVLHLVHKLHSFWEVVSCHSVCELFLASSCEFELLCVLLFFLKAVSLGLIWVNVVRVSRLGQAIEA